MKGPFEAVEVSDYVFWVGAIDWNIRDFHGYATRRGTTYNAYLVLADKITLIDTVKAPLMPEMLSRAASVVELSRVDYIVSNHAEMDHSGGLVEAIRLMHPEKVFASTRGVEALAEHFVLDHPPTAVADGETLSLGDMTLTFLETPMVHWPDSMVTLLDKGGVLFSQDAFGMHLASTERFDDELDSALLEYEAGRYYANIILPLSAMVVKQLDRIAGLRENIHVIAPDHGPIWRRDIDKIITLYRKWAAQKPTRKVVIAYDTMWQSTDLMARAIGEGAAEGGALVKVMPLAGYHRSDVVTELLDAGALLVGSPTLNGNMLPRVADLLTYLKGLKPKNLIGASFGSYGWASKAVGQVQEQLQQIGVELVADGIEAKYVPDAQVLSQCRDLGLEVARRLAMMA